MKKEITMKKWYEYRTPKGYWSTVKNDYEESSITDDEYKRVINTRWADDRITRSYTRLGYLPTRITSVAPSKKVRIVYNFIIQ